MSLIVPEIEAVRQRDPELANALYKIVNGINAVAKQTAAKPNGDRPTPTQPDSLTVTGADGIADIKIVDTSNPDKGINYFVEYDTKIDFPAPIVLDLGAARNYRTNLGNLTLYFRAYSQYIGSQPSTPVYFGAPTAVALGGAAAGPTQQTSSGSGAAPTDGTSGGSGFSRTPFNPRSGNVN